MALTIARSMPIVEPIPIQDTICSAGCVLIQNVGFGARFVMCNRQTIYEAGEDHLVVVAKIVLPWSVILPSIGYSTRFMADQAAASGNETVLRVVRG